jgi:hypothetical protein
VECELNRIQYIILKILKSNKAIDHMHSMSCEEIMDVEGKNKVTTIYKHIRILQKYGFVIRGAKIERANGYILSESAVELLSKSE